MTGRVAIYAVPGTSPDDRHGGQLRRLAESWLGRSTTGAPVAAAAPEGWARADVDALTAAARRYGFHGTLKAPFRLAEGRTLEEIDADLARFAAGHPPVALPELALSRIGSFFALVPGAPAGPLDALAGKLVQEFDGFRAAADAAETARRNPGSLSPRQRAALERWGYPYVLDEFRFHLTLTDSIEPARCDEVEAILRRWFAAILGATICLESVALFTEAEPGAPFMLHSVHPLQGAADHRLPGPHRPSIGAEGHA